MFYVNDVIWFSNPLQSLTQTDSHDSIALVPFLPSLCCCVSLFSSLSFFMPLNLFYPFNKSNILLWREIISLASSYVSHGSGTQTLTNVARKLIRAE